MTPDNVADNLFRNGRIIEALMPDVDDDRYVELAYDDAALDAALEDIMGDQDNPNNKLAFRTLSRRRHGSGIDRLAFEDAVEEAQTTLAVRTEAQRRLAAANYTGGRAMSWDDMLQDAELTPIVEEFIYTGTVNFLVARPNLGKTFAEVALGCSVALGRDFLGRKTTAGRVLFVLGEGKHGFLLRVLAWCKANGVEPDTLRDQLSFYDGGNLNNDVSFADLKTTVQQSHPDLIVFDTYAATSGVADEDRAALASETVNRAREVAQGAAILFTHHPTKSSEETANPVMRGSGALAGTADAILTMYVDSSYKAKDGASRDWLALSTERDHGGKNRNAARTTTRGLYLESVEVEGRGETAVLARDGAGSMPKCDAFAMRWMELGTVYDVNSLKSLSGQGHNQIRDYMRDSELVEVTKDGAKNVFTRISDII